MNELLVKVMLYIPAARWLTSKFKFSELLTLLKSVVNTTLPLKSVKQIFTLLNDNWKFQSNWPHLSNLNWPHFCGANWPHLCNPNWPLCFWFDYTVLACWFFIVYNIVICRFSKHKESWRIKQSVWAKSDKLSSFIRKEWAKNGLEPDYLFPRTL
mgnify:CR=1 FL=1